MWRRHITPYLKAIHQRPSNPASRHADSASHAADSKPKPHHVEFVACLERILNFGYTGAAQVLPTKLMRGIWAGRALLEHGFPVFWPGLSFDPNLLASPRVALHMWPIDRATKRPLTASKCAQAITYGMPHYLVSFSSMLLFITHHYVAGIRDRVLHAQFHLSHELKVRLRTLPHNMPMALDKISIQTINLHKEV